MNKISTSDIKKLRDLTGAGYLDCKTALVESDFYPEIGDIVDWNGFYWEINGTTEPQLIAGHQIINIKLEQLLIEQD